MAGPTLDPNYSPFPDRSAAGDALAGALRSYAGRDDVTVLGLPRGGVPVAVRVAATLGAPLDVLVVRKLGIPGQPELAMGAVAGIGGIGGDAEVVRNAEVIERAGITEAEFDAIRRRETDALWARERDYRGHRAAAAVDGRVVVVVDDGLATGSTMRAAAAALRRHGPARIVAAVPIGAPSGCAELERAADEVVCLRMPPGFIAVGQGYRDFAPTTDDEVRELLSAAG